MTTLNDPMNLKGMGGLLIDDDNEFDIDAIERSITGGFQFSDESAPAKIPDFTKEFDLETGLNDNDSTSELLKWGADPIPDRQEAADEYESDSDPGEAVDFLGDGSGAHHTWSATKPDDRQLGQITTEERKQSHINKVFGNLEYQQHDKDNDFIQMEEEEDEMARILEQIDLLYTNLESEGVNLDRIPEVTAQTSKKEARSVLKILQIKNDRARYCDMFEEGILAVAYGLESMFDGKRDWFGTKIDLVGWPETVKMKLRRMRYDTSSFVSDVMQGYAIGHGWRIVLELLPSLFLYSRDRRKRTGDNLMSDANYKDALQNLA